MAKLNVNKEVTPSGWKVDRDNWYVRRQRPGDMKGFDDCMVGFDQRGIVYLRTAEQCSQYDAGTLKVS